MFVVGQCQSPNKGLVLLYINFTVFVHAIFHTKLILNITARIETQVFLYTHTHSF